MSNSNTLFDQSAINSDIQDQMLKQAAQVNIEDQKPSLYTDEDFLRYALTHSPRAIENKILVSISENINEMAKAINSSEEQKREARDDYVKFFKRLLVCLVVFAAILILADTFFCIHVRIEFLVSVIIAIIADVIAIVHTLVKYMTNVEHFSAYNKLIDSLLKYIHSSSRIKDNTISDRD